MANDSNKPTMDGIRSNRGTAVVPTPIPQPASNKSMGSQAATLVKAPITATKQANVAPAAATAPTKPHRRLRRVFKWLLVLIIIAAVLAGLYYAYLAYYAV